MTRTLKFWLWLSFHVSHLTTKRTCLKKIITKIQGLFSISTYNSVSVLQIPFYHSWFWNERSYGGTSLQVIKTVITGFKMVVYGLCARRSFCRPATLRVLRVLNSMILWKIMIKLRKPFVLSKKSKYLTRRKSATVLVVMMALEAG